MGRICATLISLLLVSFALAGCFGDDDTGSDQEDPGPDDDGGSNDQNGTADQNGTSDQNETQERNASLSADPTEGTVPFTVTFEFNATAAGNASWFLAYGDGNSTEGDGAELPGTEEYEYTVAGNFTAVFTVTYRDGEEVTDEVEITTELGDPPQEPPETFFEYGPVAGCVAETGTCAGLEAGPDQPAIDGHWQALDERYWGLTVLVSGSAIDDTDCYFLDADQAIIGNAHNGGGECNGVVPSGTAFVYLFPWAAPSSPDGMTMEFA